MNRLEAALAAAMALSLTGCVLPNKPKTVAAAPAPPKPAPAAAPESAPGPLSVAQTRVELPKLQPLTTEAVQSTEPPEDTPAPPTNRPKNIPKKPPVSTVARTADLTPPATTTTPPATLPVAPPQPSGSERPMIQEIVPAAESSRLQTETASKKVEIAKYLQRLDQTRKHKLTPEQADAKQQVLTFVKMSDQAQKLGEVRKAHELANRGLLLAQALLDGR